MRTQRRGTVRRAFMPGCEDLEGRQLLSGVITTTNPPAALVNTLYQEILGRVPDQSGLASWVKAVNSGSTAPSVANAFWNSPEHKANPIGSTSTAIHDADTAFVSTLYLDVLVRTGDTGGIVGWSQVLNNGATTPNQVAMAFWNSPEHQAKLSAGTALPSLCSYGMTVNALYTVLLGRSPDQGGLNTWVNALYSGTITQDQMVQSFVSSAEFSAGTSNLSTNQFVTGLYSSILHRSPDAAGLAAWDQALNSGAVTRTQAVQCFWDSPEHTIAPALNLANPATYISVNENLVFDSGKYSTVTGPLFNPATGEPSPLDVQQHQIGDCWLLSTLADAAQLKPSLITNMIHYVGEDIAPDGFLVNVYAVKFYTCTPDVFSNVTETVYVDNELPSGGSIYDTPFNGNLWMSLIEKAYVVAVGQHIVTVDNDVHNGYGNEATYGYGVLNNGWASYAEHAITGNVATDLSNFTAADAVKYINSNCLVCLSTPSNPPDSHIVGSHYYALVGVNTQSTFPYELLNPWGVDASNNYWANGCVGVKYGLAWYPSGYLTESTGNFDHMSVCNMG